MFRTPLRIGVAVLALSALAAVPFAAPGDEDGTPNIDGVYGGKMKVRYSGQASDGEKGKDKAPFRLTVAQNGRVLNATLVIPDPDLGDRRWDLTGTIGNGVFGVETAAEDDFRIMVVGQVKGKKPGKYKLKFDGVYIDDDLPEVGTFKTTAKRTGDRPQ